MKEDQTKNDLNDSENYKWTYLLYISPEISVSFWRIK